MTDERTEVEILRAELQETRAIMAKVLDRLLDAVIPEPGAMLPTMEEHQEIKAEIAAPIADWTDPFIGLAVDRPANMVGRVEAGGELPFVNPQAADGAVDAWRERGDGAFDEWVAESYLPDLPDAGVEDYSPEPWVSPLDVEG